MAQGVAGHHDVHLRCADEERIEVRTKQPFGGKIGKPITQGDKLLGVFIPGPKVFFFAERLHQIVQILDQEATRSTGRV